MTDTLREELRKGVEGVTPGPWIRSGVRSVYPERAKATWIGPDGGSIIGVLFSDLTPDEYRASMADAQWVFLAQPTHISALLDHLDAQARIAELEAKAHGYQATLNKIAWPLAKTSINPFNAPDYVQSALSIVQDYFDLSPSELRAALATKEAKDNG